MSKETMEAKAEEIRRAYYREWRAKNKDKVKAYNRNRWLKKAAALAASEQSNENGGNNDERKD